MLSFPILVSGPELTVSVSQAVSPLSASAKLFVTEASLAGKLSHPHIVSIYDAVADDEASYIVMEYVDGTTLEQYSRAENLLPSNKVIEIVFKCTKALD